MLQGSIPTLAAVFFFFPLSIFSIFSKILSSGFGWLSGEESLAVEMLVELGLRDSGGAEERSNMTAFELVRRYSMNRNESMNLLGVGSDW